MRTDVLVIGGGLAGTATAYYLAREGVDVLLVERFDLNMQASGSNAGSIHAQIPMEPFLTKGEAWVRGFAPTIPLMLASIRLWSGLETELGADLEVSLRGGLCVAETDAQMRAIERKAVVERAQGLPVELLGRDELRRLAPYLAPGMIGGAFCGIEGKANPLAVAPAQLTMRRAAIGPSLVATVNPRSIACTVVPHRIRAPCRRAALAKAGATARGLALPSMPQNAAPIMLGAR